MSRYEQMIEWLLQYHSNLCEQVSNGSFNHRGLDRSIKKMRAVEDKLERLLEIDPGERR